MNSAQFAAEQSKCLYCADAHCLEDCPAGCSPREFLKAVQMGQPQDFQRAAAEILSQNPMGEVCGLVCPDKFCQSRCNRQGLDASIQIPCSQSYIVGEARRLGREPKFVGLKANGKKVAIVGAGPAGLAACALLSQQGYAIDVFESGALGGQAAMIPVHRLPAASLKADVEFCLYRTHDESVKVEVKKEHADPVVLAPKYDFVIDTTGQSENVFPPEFENIKEFILQPQQIFSEASKYAGKKMLVIGGGAVAVDVCATLHGQKGQAIVAYRRTIAQMPVTRKEQQELLECAEIITKVIVKSAAKTENGLSVKLARVEITGRGSDMKQTETGEELVLHGIQGIVLASGFTSAKPKESPANVIFCQKTGTVVQAVAAGKSCARIILEGLEARKSTMEDGHGYAMKGYNFFPADLTTNIFGAKNIPNPFVLSASPVTDGYHECKKALDAGWGGVVLKTAFDGLDIHIPSNYMSRMGDECHANCDNVSGRTLDQVIADIARLKVEYPDRLIAASTGGPVFGEDDVCRNGWQKNIGKLVKGGAELVELSLSCPQGGDSSEGSIAAQSVTQSCKIVRWALETPELHKGVPLLFKMTAACTSVETVIRAVQKVIDEYPNKNAAITMANSFPAVDIKPTVRTEGGYPFDCIVVGLGGKHVLPISYLSLTSLYNVPNLQISGNGGIVNYKSAADFIALGTSFVQICALAEERGVRIYNDIASGLSHFMKELGYASIPQLFRSFKKPVLEFMEIPPTKPIAKLVLKEQCIGCGNCEDCPYLAIKMTEKGKIEVDPRRCIGCSLCTRRCPGKCLDMVERPAGVPQPDI